MQQAYGLPARFKVWVTGRNALLQSRIRNSSRPRCWPTQQSLLQRPKQHPSFHRSLSLDFVRLLLLGLGYLRYARMALLLQGLQEKNFPCTLTHWTPPQIRLESPQPVAASISLLQQHSRFQFTAFYFIIFHPRSTGLFDLGQQRWISDRGVIGKADITLLEKVDEYTILHAAAACMQLDSGQNFFFPYFVFYQCLSSHQLFKVSDK